MTDKEEDLTIIIEKDQDFLEELSDYLDVLSSNTRLKILKSIERYPKDVRQISSEIKTSYENTKKHLDKLLLVGIIKKEAGMSERPSVGHPVWKYSVIPGGLEAIIQNLAMFGNVNITLNNRALSSRLEHVKEQVSDELIGKIPLIFLIGGPDDGRVFPLKNAIIRIGRDDPHAKVPHRPGDIVLSDSYAAVTRISKPHCTLSREDSIWYIEDCGSTGGTYINNTILEKGKRQELADGDLIDLAKGSQGARLAFKKPPAHESCTMDEDPVPAG